MRVLFIGTVKFSFHALQKLVDAEDKLSTLEKFKLDLFTTYK